MKGKFDAKIKSLTDKIQEGASEIKDRLSYVAHFQPLVADLLYFTGKADGTEAKKSLAKIRKMFKGLASTAVNRALNEFEEQANEYKKKKSYKTKIRLSNFRLLQ